MGSSTVRKGKAIWGTLLCLGGAGGGEILSRSADTFNPGQISGMIVLSSGLVILGITLIVFEIKNIPLFGR